MVSVGVGESGLSSERLVYKRITSDDLEDYTTWYTNPEVMKYVTGRPLTREETASRFQDKLKQNAKWPTLGAWYSVRVKESPLVFMGIAKLTYEDEGLSTASVGYGMLPPYWGKGYGTEMLKALVNLARRIPGITELTAVTHPDNTPSNKILLNQGFKSTNQSMEDGSPSLHFVLSL